MTTLQSRRSTGRSTHARLMLPDEMIQYCRTVSVFVLSHVLFVRFILFVEIDEMRMNLVQFLKYKKKYSEVVRFIFQFHAL